MPPLIKTIPALVLSAMILPATTEGAVIIANEVYLTIADGGGTLVSAEAATVPTNAWFRPDLPMPYPWEPPLGFGWMGMGGGRVTLQTDPGETVSSVTIYLGDGPNGLTPWTFALLSYGETPEIQIWQSTNPPNGNGVPGGFISPPFNRGTTAPFYFEVVTSSGTIGNQYYAVSTVPEPSAAILAGIAGAAVVLRRRR